MDDKERLNRVEANYKAAIQGRKDFREAYRRELEKNKRAQLDLATLEQWQAESVGVIRGIIAFNKKWFGRYPEKYLGPTAALALEEWTKGAQVLLERAKGEGK